MDLSKLTDPEKLIIKRKLLERHWNRSLEDSRIFLWGDGKLPGFIWTVDEAEEEGAPRKRFPDRPYLRFLLWTYLKNKKLVIMKSRQMMVTWFMCAMVLHLVLQPGKRVLVFTKQEKGSSANLDRIWALYQYLPEHLRPKATYSGGVIKINHEQATSYVQAAVKNTNDPRQFVFSSVWIDESAFAPETLDMVGAALPTVAKGGRLILSTTPNGREITYQILTDNGRISDHKLHRPFKDLNPELYDLTFKDSPLPPEPNILQRGISAWKNLNGYACVLLHFTADPEGPDEELRRDGSISEQSFQRENHLDFASFSGTPVFADSYEPLKCEQSDLLVVKGAPLWLSHDFGRRNPAVTIHQFLGNGAWSILGEIGSHDIYLGDFIEQFIKPYLKRRFPWALEEDKHLLMHAADVAGTQGTANSKYSAFQIMQQHGFYCYARKQSISEGLDLIKAACLRTKNDQPGFKIDPEECPITVEAMRAGYRFADDRPNRPQAENPLKDGCYDHYLDTLRYVAVQNLSLLEAKPKEEKPGPTFVERILAAKEEFYDEYGEWYA